MTNVLQNATSSETRVDTCAGAPPGLLRELTPHDAHRLQAATRCEQVPAGAVLWRQGAPATTCAVVTAGTAEVQRGGKRAGRLEPGAFAGVAPLLARRPHTATVVAATPLTVWWIDGDALDRLLVDAPTFGRLVAQRMARATVAASF
jgi:CRP-like cAMP-binding protein